MIVVGVGCCPDMLTESAIKTIQIARLIVGSERAIDLARSHIHPEAECRIIEDYKDLHDLPSHAIILSTGDPMVSGLGYLGGTIIPGISSVQAGAAKTGISLTNIFIITAHGRDHDKAIRDCYTMLEEVRKTCIIADPAFPVEDLCRRLAQSSVQARITICENLGYRDERISEGTTENPPIPDGSMFIIFVTPEC